MTSHARLAQNLPSSGLGSKHGSFVLALREIFVGAQTGSRLIQLASSRQKEFAFRREDINECFLEFAIKPSDVVLFSHDFPFTLGSAAARDGRHAGSAYQLPNFQRPLYRDLGPGACTVLIPFNSIKNRNAGATAPIASALGRQRKGARLRVPTRSDLGEFIHSAFSAVIMLGVGRCVAPLPRPSWFAALFQSLPGIAQRKPLIEGGVTPRHRAFIDISSKQVAKAPSTEVPGQLARYQRIVQPRKVRGAANFHRRILRTRPAALVSPGHDVFLVVARV